MEMEKEEQSVQKRPRNGRKWEEIELLGCLGAHWGPSWRQDGARATTRAKKKLLISVSLRAAKM